MVWVTYVCFIAGFDRIKAERDGISYYYCSRWSRISKVGVDPKKSLNDFMEFGYFLQFQHCCYFRPPANTGKPPVKGIQPTRPYVRSKLIIHGHNMRLKGNLARRSSQCGKVDRSRFQVVMCALRRRSLDQRGG
jgi:hypothetical protein